MTSLIGFTVVECPQGLWGIDCSKSCDCNSRGPCYHVDGQCDCQSGWIGERCDTSELCWPSKQLLCLLYTGGGGGGGEAKSLKD